MRFLHGVTALGCAIGIFACSSSDTPSGGTDASTSADTSTGTDAAHADTGSVSDTGTGADTSAPDAGCAKPGTAVFGAICATDCDCASTACFFGGQGSYCSIHCTAATAAQDCPNPPTSGTCNNQGYCKK